MTQVVVGEDDRAAVVREPEVRSVAHAVRPVVLGPVTTDGHLELVVTGRQVEGAGPGGRLLVEGQRSLVAAGIPVTRTPEGCVERAGHRDLARLPLGRWFCGSHG